MLASASDAIVVGFNTKITETARRAAEAEGVDVRLYDIIYKLTDDIDAALKGLLEPEVGRGRRGPRRGPPDLPRRQEHGHRRLRSSPTAASSGPAPASGAAARSSRPTGSSRSGGSATTSARSPRTTSAASAWRTSTTSRRATSSSASRRRRSAASRPPEPAPAGQAATDDASEPNESTSCCARRSARSSARDVADPRIGFATITDVETTPDLRHARVWVSVIGQPEERKATRRGARPGDAVRPARAGQAAAPQADPRVPPRARRHRSSAAPASCSSSTSSRRADDAGRAAGRRVAADAGRAAPP